VTTATRRPYTARVSRRGLHQEVVHNLGLAIVRGDHPPGELLARGEQLAASMGVSRTVLREAMMVLAETRLPQLRPLPGPVKALAEHEMGVSEGLRSGSA